MRTSVFVLVLALSVAACASNLVIHEAGFKGRRGPALFNGFKFCPKWFSAKGFSVVCNLSYKPKYVTFFVNGKFVRNEFFPPYTIKGDVNGYIFPWKNAPKDALITCLPRGGNPISKTISVTCEKPKAKPSKPAPKKRKPAMKPKKPKMMPKKPAMKPKKPKMMPRKPPTKPPAKPKKPKMMPKKPPTKPRKPPMKPPTKPAPKPTGGKGSCVVIRVGKYQGPLRGGWVRKGDGLAYKPNDNYEGVVGGSKAPLAFYFRVHVPGTYGVTVDMTTSHWTEHNDIWLKLPFGRGFTLRRFSKVRKGGTGYLKAYHNYNKRATAAFSVDFNPHSFSTADVLKPGRTYKIIVGARSTKVTVHKIIMFRCDGIQCQSGSAVWRRYVNICK